MQSASIISSASSDTILSTNHHLVILVAFLGYRVVTDKGAEMIVGAVIVWLGQIFTFYYRKVGSTKDSPAQT